RLNRSSRRDNCASVQIARSAGAILGARQSTAASAGAADSAKQTGIIPRRVRIVILAVLKAGTASPICACSHGFGPAPSLRRHATVFNPEAPAAPGGRLSLSAHPNGGQ